MITRIWHGRTVRENAETSLQVLLTNGTKDYKGKPGSLPMNGGVRKAEGCCHFYA